MRKGKRFTPALLDKWHRDGRGTGSGANFEPWHQVTRSDPGSRGRSHLLNWKFERLHHLLSDQEFAVLGFISMMPNLIDLREQFRLEFDSHEVHRAAFDQGGGRWSDGTDAIAKALGYRHPVIRKDGVVRPWVFSTDFLATIESPPSRHALLAISVKDCEITDPRKLELLEIEREYWIRQDVFWLLISPVTYQRRIEFTLRTGMAWNLGRERVAESLLTRCGEISEFLHGQPFTRALHILASELALDTVSAQLVFWQSVWSGYLCLDLTMSIRPSAVVKILSSEDFWKQNPVVSRRTAWRA